MGGGIKERKRGGVFNIIYLRVRLCFNWSCHNKNCCSHSTCKNTAISTFKIVTSVCLRCGVKEERECTEVDAKGQRR